jgi:hypothetical protein
MPNSLADTSATTSDVPIGEVSVKYETIDTSPGTTYTVLASPPQPKRS